MAREHAPAASPAETAARHYAVLQELRRSPGGDPLSATAPTATINNPQWFNRHHGFLRLTLTREALHDQIAADLVSHGRVAAPSAQPVAILLAGPPGSGKSTSFQDVFDRNDTAVTNGLSRQDFAVIDADHIKGRLIEQARNDGSLESWIKPQAVRDLEAAGERFSPLDLASLVHEESSLIADKARNMAIDQRRNVVFDQVCSSPTKTAQLVDRLSSAGYKVSVVEIHATREFSLESTFGRYVATAERGGDARRVPTEVVESVFTPDGASRPRAAIEALLTASPSKVTEYRRYDAHQLAKPPVLVQTGTRTPAGHMARRPVTPALERATPQNRKTKADVLAAQRDRARNLVNSAKRAPAADRRGPTR